MKKVSICIHISLLSILFGILCPLGAIAQETGQETILPEDQEDVSGLSASSAPGTNVVGSPSGQFAVSPTGAATYSVAIDVPPGIGGMQPQVGIAYNSQSGMGNVGWGCNITGVSSITRGVKDIFRDNVARGIRYTNNDAYYLDGRRLVFASGTEGEVGSTYVLEDDPFTTVTVKGTSTSTSDNRWFEVKTSDGMTLQYGSVQSARQYVAVSGTTYNSAWHLQSVTDACGRTITYAYARSDNYTYIQSISYGGTAAASTVTFSYTSPGDAAQTFRQKGVACKMDKLLTTITCKTGSSTFRTYELSYSYADGTAVKFPRLTAINVKGADGSSLNPITLAWNYLPAESKTATSATGLYFDRNDDLDAACLITGDVNGDGLSDIISILSYKISGSYQLDIDAYTNKGNSSSSVSFQRENLYGTLANWRYIGLYGTGTIIDAPDFDADGLSDILIPLYESTYGLNFMLYYGSTMMQKRNDPDYLGCALEGGKSSPLVATGDFNNDGKSDILVVETQKKASDGKYYCSLLTDVGNLSSERFLSSYSLPSAPKNLLVGDYNNDGLTDFIVLYDNGYSVIFNGCGKAGKSSPFDNPDIVSGTNVKNSYRIVQGDFNGDNTVDFLSVGGNSGIYHFALGMGNGTFQDITAATLGIHDQPTNKDDGRFTILVCDYNYDGKSDVLIAKSMYDYHGGLNSKYTYDFTAFVWLHSTGTALVEDRRVTVDNEEGARPYNFLVGDFYGKGQACLFNYGNNIYAQEATPTIGYRVYKDTCTPQSGKVSSVTDGFGNTTQLSYASLTTPSVYTKGVGCSYPLADLQVPLHVVSSVTVPTVAGTDGAAATMTENYTYGGLKAHVAGRGLLGFATTAVANDVAGTTTVTETSGWTDNAYFMPTHTTSTTTLSDGSSSTTETAISVVPKGTGVLKKYYCHPQTVTATDFDGYTTSTTYTYDDNKGKPTLEKTVFDGESSTNYKQVAYTYGTAQYGGQWLPVQITRTQRHRDDTQPFSTTQKITYNAATGLPTQVIDNYGTSLALTTASTYDTYGNLTSQAISGQGLNTVTRKHEYDSSKRFVTKSYTVPASTVTTYTHDLWGNVLTETDATVTSNQLTTTYTYDGFGNLQASTSPEGIHTEVTRSWVSSPGCYQVHTATTGKPWSTTWYDSRNRKVMSQSIGPDDTAIKDVVVYDARGNVAANTSVSGDITSSASMTYDARNRLSSEILSTGRSTTYSYTGRKVTATATGSRTSEKAYDAWGLLKQSKEPVGTVYYTYKSCGKPSAASSGFGTVTMAYDACGNQIRLTDPDAGTTTYTYNAQGDVVSQTDARGITTRDSLDMLNRVVKTTTGSTVVSYTYGSSGNATHRLASLAMGGKTISYAYDQYGRVSSETRSFGTTSYTTSYTYDSSGRLSTATYPGSIIVTYIYDSYGHEISMAVNGGIVWTLSSHTGTATVETLGTGTSALRRSTSRNSHGLLTGITLQKLSGGTGLHSMTFGYDAVTGNLTQRTGMIPGEGELFTYDKVDRLVRYQNTNGHWDDILQYGTDGNIEFKTGLGSYGYPPGGKPHAVANVTNTGGLVSSADQIITYNDLGKASEIRTDHGTAGRYAISYGPDGERWEMEHYKSSAQWPDTVRYYLGGMEGYKVGSSDPVWIYHLGHGVILRKTGLSASTQPTVYYTFEDNLGSVMRIYNTAGTAVFSASYDPWGVQTVKVNTIGYNRGYCGHEMLNAFQLINMNGRFYDPYLGRFLSPDNYVQMPTSAQSFNRYSYCLNNPLKYTDPSGELLWAPIAINAFVHGLGNLITHANRHDLHNVGDWFKYFGEGAIVGATLSTISQVAPTVNAPYIGKGLNVISKTLNFFDKVQYYSEIGGAVISTITQGIPGLKRSFKIMMGNYYLDEHRNFLDAIAQGITRHTWEKIQTSLGETYAQLQNAIGTTDRVEYFGGVTFSINENANVRDGKGMTVGNFSYVWDKQGVVGKFDDYIKTQGLYMHEYGHTIDSQIWGFAYLLTIGIPSFIDASNAHSDHKKMYAEKWANRHSKRYFGRLGVDWDLFEKKYHTH